MGINTILNSRGEDLDVTADDDVLGPIQDLRRAIGMPDRQVARVQYVARKQPPCGVGILVIPPRADISQAHDLPDLLAIPLYVLDHALGYVGPDHADGQAGNEAVALTRHLPVPLRVRQCVPFRQGVALGDGSVRLGEPVHVHRMQIQRRHPLEQMRRGRAGGDSDADGAWQPLRRLGGAQQGVDRRRGAVVRDSLVLKQPPDLGVVDAA